MKGDSRSKGTNNQKRILAKQIQNLNKHLPKKKKTLKELLKEEKPSLKTKDNEKILLEKKELKKISEKLPNHFHNKLKIPIYIEAGKKFGKGSYRIKGKAEARLIRRLLDKEKDISKKEIFLNRIEVRKIRNQLRTTTKYMFTVDLSEITNKKKNEMGRTKRR
ncbi:hypothetical protein C9439_06290 [archaeon SCG-AAA382B04]|nr:hypothetical protein C9439_06290 [archaeon SCG-AAA382B04]